MFALQFAFCKKAYRLSDEEIVFLYELSEALWVRSILPHRILPHRNFLLREISPPCVPPLITSQRDVAPETPGNHYKPQGF